MSEADARRRTEFERQARAAGLEPWQKELTDAVSDDLLRDVVRDSRRQSPHKFDPLPQPQTPAQANAPAQPKPYRLPPGTAVVDRMVAVQDRIDLAERERMFAAAGMPAKREG